MQHPPEPLTASFVQLLHTEERLLGEAREGLLGVHESLRRGDFAALEAVRPQQELLASALRDAESRRTELACELAAVLGLPANQLTLRALAERLPGPVAGELEAARERLTAATAALADVQRRNANLVGHLRSFFRGVLADLTAADGPVRYGPSGGRLAPAAGAAIQASG